MTFKITAQEGPQAADSLYYVIRTRVPYSEVTDEMIAQRCRAANLRSGDIVLVQCCDHTYETLLHEAEYRVVQRLEKLTTVEINDRDSKTFNHVTMVMARVRPWWSSPLGAQVDAAERELLGDDLEVTWNPGKKKFEVKRGEAVVAEDRDKATALEMAKAA